MVAAYTCVLRRYPRRTIRVYATNGCDPLLPLKLVVLLRRETKKAHPLTAAAAVRTPRHNRYPACRMFNHYNPCSRNASKVLPRLRWRACQRCALLDRFDLNGVYRPTATQATRVARGGSASSPAKMADENGGRSHSIEKELYGGMSGGQGARLAIAS